MTGEIVPRWHKNRHIDQRYTEVGDPVCERELTVFKDDHLGFADFAQVDAVTATHFLWGGGRLRFGREGGREGRGGLA